MTKTLSTGAALAAMLAYNACPTRAFQPGGIFVASPYRAAVVAPTTAIEMRCSSPWDNFGCYDDQMQPFRRGPGRMGRGFRRSPPGGRSKVFVPPTFEPALNLGDPAVEETDEGYRLVFKVPAAVDDDGLDVSVTDRVLTLRARATRDEPGIDTAWGWVSRSSRTDTVARSFVLPEGLETSGVTSSRRPDGAFEVRFNRGTSSTAEEKQKISKGGAEQRLSGGKPASSASADYLSGLTTASADAASSSTEDPKTSTASADADIPVSSDSASSDRSDERSSDEANRRPRTVLEALDAEFGEFAKLMWGEEGASALRFPTQEEMAAQVQAAREERARRVMAIQRASMSAEVSEKDGSYVVSVALPENARREDVSLSVLPGGALRVSCSCNGHPARTRDVRLPQDALSSTSISAKFRTDTERNPANDEASGDSTHGDFVSGLMVTVGRAERPQPQRIEIL